MMVDGIAKLRLHGRAFEAVMPLFEIARTGPDFP